MSALTMPERSFEQRRAALKIANEVRTYRAEIKRDLAAGRIHWTDLLDDPHCRSMKVWEAVMCLPKIGRVKAGTAFRRCMISHSKTFAGLTWRQRDALRTYFG